MQQLEAVISSLGQGERRVGGLSGLLTIGRGADCSIALESTLVSRCHVTVEVHGTKMRVYDSSRNGTLAGKQYVNNAMAEVPVGTALTVGEFTITIGKAGGHGAHVRGGAHGSHAPVPVHAARADQPHANAPTEPPPASAGKAAADRELELAEVSKRKDAVLLRREIHRLLIEHLDLATVEAAKLDDPSLRPKVLTALRRIVKTLEDRIPPDTSRDQLVGEMVDEALGLGPLENLLGDPTISEIMVVDADTIYIEQRGKLTRSTARFTDDERVRAIIERIVTPLGRRIDESSPIVDARLRDGSRVNAVIRPLALRGSAITIRKFSKSPLTMAKLVDFGALTEGMGQFLTRCVVAKKNIVISGGTGSGKTTLLNVLSAAIPSDERIVTIEDAAELQLGHLTWFRSNARRTWRARASTRFATC